MYRTIICVVRDSVADPLNTLIVQDRMDVIHPTKLPTARRLYSLPKLAPSDFNSLAGNMLYNESGQDTTMRDTIGQLNEFDKRY